MEIPLYQIDAFSHEVFKGNPAAVCPLQEWLPDNTMQAIAAENNLSETAFYIATNSGFHIRWFTPTREVKLCGHATLATAFVLFNELNYASDVIIFESLSGPLQVRRINESIEMNFPVNKPKECEPPTALLEAFQITPLEFLAAEDYIVVFEQEADVINAQPNLEMLRKLDLRAVCITARGSEYDFVNRLFAPNYGIDEDPVTGSAFTQLTPYWSEKLNKTQFVAKQLSKRSGIVECELIQDRVKITGQAKKYLQGKIFIE